MAYLYFNSRDEILRIDVSKIVYLEANGNYTNIVTANKQVGIVGMNLAQTQKQITDTLKSKANNFARIGRRYIINLDYIYQINIIKQNLVLSDLSLFAYQLKLSRESAKALKDIVIQKTQG